MVPSRTCPRQDVEYPMLYAALWLNRNYKLISHPCQIRLATSLWLFSNTSRVVSGKNHSKIRLSMTRPVIAAWSPQNCTVLLLSIVPNKANPIKVSSQHLSNFSNQKVIFDSSNILDTIFGNWNARKFDFGYMYCTGEPNLDGLKDYCLVCSVAAAPWCHAHRTPVYQRCRSLWV